MSIFDGYKKDGERVVNFTDTVGITQWDDVEWVTAVNSRLLWDWLELVQFCYPDKENIAIGLYLPTDVDAEYPALVAGFPDEDRVIALSAKYSMPDQCTGEGE